MSKKFQVQELVRRAPAEARDLRTLAVGLARTGVLKPSRPDRLLAMGAAFLRTGPTFAGGYAAGAARHPNRVALIDEKGRLTYREVTEQAQALAAGLAKLGVGPGSQVAVLLRNSRYLILALAALSHLGADALLLNTGFSGPQATEVMTRLKAAAVVFDEEFRGVVAEGARGRPQVVGWTGEAAGGAAGGAADGAATTIDGLLAENRGARSRRPSQGSRMIILTSGTTGTPKGAARSAGNSSANAGVLAAIPYRADETFVIAAPIFHAWGLGSAATCLALGSTMVLRRRFDPESTLADVAKHKAQALAVVPVMMQRILDLPEDVRRRYDVSSLRVVATSGSALPGDLAQRFMDAFGDVVYNLYGSTEIAMVSVAGPADLRAAPGTAGRVLPGVRVELLDENDRPVPAGQVGRLFIGSRGLFEGYEGGGDKLRVRGMASIGDLGQFDAAGRLFVRGRDDDMIVSGGENVFPAEVEDLLAQQPEVEEVAVIGVDDEQFGQRLAAFVVVREGATLTADDVKARVKAQLAGYKVPREVIFVDELPRNATGKILKRELKSQVGS